MIYALYTCIGLLIIFVLGSDFIAEKMANFIFKKVSPLFVKDKHDKKRIKKISKILCNKNITTKEQNEAIYKLFDEEQHRKKIEERKLKLKKLNNENNK